MVCRLLSGGRSLICSIYQYLWCKYSHHSQFQVTKVKSRDLQLGRDVKEPGITWYFYHTDIVAIDYVKGIDNTKMEEDN